MVIGVRKLYIRQSSSCGIWSKETMEAWVRSGALVMFADDTLEDAMMMTDEYNKMRQLRG